MTNPSIEKVTNKQISLYQQYLRYAMDSFVQELSTIKSSITHSVMAELKSKNPAMDNAEMQKRVAKMVDEKLSIVAQIKFED